MKVNELFESINHEEYESAAKKVTDTHHSLLNAAIQPWEGEKHDGATSVMYSLHSGSFLKKAKSEKAVKDLVATLNADPTFKKYWHSEAVLGFGKKWEFHVQSLVVQKEHQARERKSLRALERGRVTKINVPDTVPTSRFSKTELIRIAEKVGHILYDKHGSGLIWSGKPKVEFTNTLRLAKEYADAMGEDALQLEWFTPGTFEFVFKPSSETGIDASDTVNFVLGAAKLKDKDGNIYLCDNTDYTLIRVVAPVIKTKAEYEAIVSQKISKQRK